MLNGHQLDLIMKAMAEVAAKYYPHFDLPLDKIVIRPIEKPRPFDSGRVMPKDESLNRSLKRMMQMEGGIR